MKDWKNPKKFNVIKQEQQLSHKLTLMHVESFLLVFLFVFINCLVPRDHQQIAFVMLNRFCLLRKTSHPLFLMDYIKLDEILSKIK